ncbi:MAG: hypothetical protein RR614_13835, partial [Eubacterium sp.]
MEDHEKNLKNDPIGDPSPAMTFIFMMVMLVFWGMFAGVVKGKTEILLGCIQLAMFPGYMLGAYLFYKKGNTLFATLYMMFATVF